MACVYCYRFATLVKMIRKNVAHVFRKRIPCKRSHAVAIILCISVIAADVWFRNRGLPEIRREMSVKIPRGLLNVSLKYILMWSTGEFQYKFKYLGWGRDMFIRHQCPHTNCHITKKKFLLGDVSKFDAIVFKYHTVNSSDLPQTRSPHQKYIYYNIESSDNFPVCEPQFDGFFNWTATYRTNSDILFTYIKIKNKAGEVIGPGQNVDWVRESPDVDAGLTSELRRKSKAAVMFASNCFSRSYRLKVLADLRTALHQYGLTIDVYGACGLLQCPKSDQFLCMQMVRRDYYFYLAFENSFDEDYVTEKLLNALDTETIPIVYGGADYSRFLPCNSYLNARQYSAEELAAVMYLLMTRPALYRQYFTWKKSYTYYDPRGESICSLCAALNNKTMMETHSAYHNFRKWWNPRHRKACPIVKSNFTHSLFWSTFH